VCVCVRARARAPFDMNLENGRDERENNTTSSMPRERPLVAATLVDLWPRPRRNLLSGDARVSRDDIAGR